MVNFSNSIIEKTLAFSDMGISVIAVEASQIQMIWKNVRKTRLIPKLNPVMVAVLVGKNLILPNCKCIIKGGFKPTHT